MPRLQSLRGSFGSPPHKEPTLRGGLRGHSPPACLRRKQTSPSSTSLVRQDLQRKGASWEGRLGSRFVGEGSRENHQGFARQTKVWCVLPICPFRTIRIAI